MVVSSRCVHVTQLGVMQYMSALAIQNRLVTKYKGQNGKQIVIIVLTQTY